MRVLKQVAHRARRAFCMHFDHTDFNELRKRVVVAASVCEIIRRAAVAIRPQCDTANAQSVQKVLIDRVLCMFNVTE